MKRALTSIFLLSTLKNCGKGEYVSPDVFKTPCVFEDLRRRGDLVQKAPVLLIEGRFYYLTHLDSTTM